MLHGVTGSGKTELYLRLADLVRRSGRGVLLLVPEIALTPAVAALFRGAFGDRVAIQHSGLSDGERHDQWHRIRRGEVDVVVGTRSAVFAPLRDLGLVIVDEEHDGSYKQEESPRYHARDVAVVRAQQAGAFAVLGSATPSMETFHNAQSGRYRLVVLKRRVLDRPMAEVRIVDMREEFAAGGPDVILSSALVTALGQRFERGEQAIVLLNRRGFATVVFCRQCGHTLECPELQRVIDRAQGDPACALPLLQSLRRHPDEVRQVQRARILEQQGFGTERVELEIRKLFPAARVARVDRDTVRRRGAITGLLTRFGAGDLDILVGTQMIAKGHDFPRVTLVGVISADVGLGMADFRAGERTFQLLTQVAGRSGRGELPGEALVQTLYPTHYSIRHACRQDYAAFFVDEIEFRRRDEVPAGGRDDQRGGQGADAGGGDGRRRRHRAGAAMGRGAVPRARPGARAAQPIEGRTPRPVLHQGDASRLDAQGAGRRAGCPTRDQAANRGRRGPDVGPLTRVSVDVADRRSSALGFDQRIDRHRRETEDEDDQRQHRDPAPSRLGSGSSS